MGTVRRVAPMTPDTRMATILAAPAEGVWVVPMFTVVAKLANEGPGVVSHRVEHDQTVRFFKLVAWRFDDDGSCEPLVVSVRTGATMATEIVPLSEVFARYAPTEGASSMADEFRRVREADRLKNLGQKIAYRGEEEVWADLRRRAELEIAQDPQQGPEREVNDGFHAEERARDAGVGSVE